MLSRHWKSKQLGHGSRSNRTGQATGDALKEAAWRLGNRLAGYSIQDEQIDLFNSVWIPSYSWSRDSCRFWLLQIPVAPPYAPSPQTFPERLN